MANVYGATAIGLLTFFLINYSFCVSLELEHSRYDVLSDLPNLSNFIGSYSIVQLKEKQQTHSKTQYQNIPQNPNISIPPSDRSNNNTTNVDVKQEPPGNAAQSSTPTPSILIPIETNEKPLLGVNGIKAAVRDGDVPESESLQPLENRNAMIKQISGDYYNSTIYINKDQADELWNSFKNVSPNALLSGSHRRAVTVELSFDFPYYDKLVRKVAVGTGGFLYTGEYVHSWLAGTQYIAPLMANFDTSLSNDSFVKFYDNGTAFTVIWEKLLLQYNPDVGAFSFSTTLHKNGDIVFTYFNLPILIDSIQRPVKIGLSDAALIDRVVFFERRKSAYRYHHLNFANSDVSNSTIIFLKALPNCLNYTDCASCLQQDTSIECAWNPILKRCSRKTNQQRQAKLHKDECDELSDFIDSQSKVQLREKRQTDSKTQYQSIPQNPNTSVPTPDQSNNNTTNIDVKPSNAAQSSTPTPSIIIPIETNEKPLLGVNGTGQRKDYGEKSTTKPAVVSEPIQPGSKKPTLFPKKTLTATAAVPTVLISTETPLEEIVDNVDVPENETLQDLENRNFTVNQTSDHHVYYNSTIYINKDQANAFWDSFKNVSPNAMLSASHRRAMTVELSFDFPFYGNLVRNVTVATGGFLYTGEYVHSWLAATQYIAPLMANFDTSLSNDSFVKFYDNGTAFTVIWEKVSLQDKQDVGTFTFSTTLHKNGDIVFTYFSVPILINSIQDDKHPVKVGLSDAYIIDKVVFFARRKTIYEYHRVNFGSSDINNSTIIFLKALPTCLTYTDCASCIQHETSFECSWCPILNRCSTGTDRKRQDWLHKGCDRGQINVLSGCPPIGQKGNNAAQSANTTITDHSDISHTGTNYYPPKASEESPETPHTSKSVLPVNKAAASDVSISEDGETHSMGVALGFLLPICLIMSVLVWILYAYRNPHTKSGQLLIQYRPSQWSWRRGEARYTAATIHM